MNMRKMALAAAAAASMAWGSMASAATLNMGITLLDSANNPLTPVAGIYTIPQGTKFRVQLSATVTSPNTTDGFHSADGGDTFAPSIQLGIQSLSFNVVSGGTSGVVVPFANGSKWGQRNTADTSTADAVALTNPTSLVPGAPNLNDADADGDLDVTGAGYANLAFQTYDGSSSANALQNGLPAVAVNVQRGTYTANALGTTTLTINGVAGNFLFDPASTGVDNALSTQAFGANIATLPVVNIVVAPVPEPTSLALLGLGGVGLLARRRRMA